MGIPAFPYAIPEAGQDRKCAPGIERGADAQHFVLHVAEAQHAVGAHEGERQQHEAIAVGEYSAAPTSQCRQEGYQHRAGDDRARRDVDHHPGLHVGVQYMPHDREGPAARFREQHADQRGHDVVGVEGQGACRKPLRELTGLESRQPPSTRALVEVRRGNVEQAEPNPEVRRKEDRHGRDSTTGDTPPSNHPARHGRDADQHA